DLTGELGVAARHEGGHLLVPDLDQLRIALGTVERAEERVDPVARVAVDAVDVPLAQTLEVVVGDELCHWFPSFARTAAARAAAPPPNRARCLARRSWMLRARDWSSNGPCAAWSPGTGSKRLSGRSGSTGSSVCWA